MIVYESPKIELLNCDCMEYMAGVPDKFFDLAIVDPPYGIGAGGKSFVNRNTANLKNEKFYRVNDWDKCPPDSSYWVELMRISKHWIVFGGNYFTNFLPPSRCFIVWDKKTGNNSYADCELALTSINSNARIYTKFWLGAHAVDSDGRFHPTQKPIDLYRWLLKNYAKEGDKILDTHGGSMSSAIACHQMGFDLTLCELDKDYYEAGVKRFREQTMQQSLFKP